MEVTAAAPVRPTMTNAGSPRASTAALTLPTPSSIEINWVLACPKACGSSAAENAELKAEILGDANRDRIINRPRTHALRPRQDFAQTIAALAERHRSDLSL